MTPAIETVEALDEHRAMRMISGTHGALGLAQAIFLARIVREADERAGLVTLPGVMTNTARQTIRDNGGPTALAYALAAWIDILRTNPFASAAQGEGGE